MGDAFLHGIRTPLHSYIFDVNTNRLIRIDDPEVYRMLVEDRRDGPPEKLEQIRALEEQGFLSDRRPTKMRHPQTDALAYQLDTNIEQVTIQLTQQCNFRCAYCTYAPKDFKSQREHTAKRLPWELAKQIVDFYAAHSANQEKPTIGFYGGEPLLEYELLQKIVLYAEAAFEGKDLQFTITTNGSLLTPDKAEFFLAHNVGVMLSLDGSPQAHNRSRKFAANGQGTFAAIERNLRRIQQRVPAFLETLQVNVVIDARFGCAEVYRYFDHEPLFSAAQVQSTLIDDGLSAEQTVPSERFQAEQAGCYFRAMLALLGRYPAEKASKMACNAIQTGLAKTEKNLRHSGVQPEMSHGGPCLPGQRRLFVNVDGALFPCERVSENSPATKIGTIQRGFDYAQAERLLNVAALTEGKCNDCWGVQHCMQCVRNCDNGGALSAAYKVSHCPGTLRAIENDFREYLLWKELGEEATPL